MINNSGRTFLSRLRSLRPDDETIRNLRWVLKRTLRQHGFWCLSVSEEVQENQRRDNNE